MSWPTRDGDLQARRFSPVPGATRGSVAARWVPPERDRIECVVVAGDGRIAVAMGKTVHVLAPDLRPLERHDLDGYVRDVVAAPGGFLAAAKSDVHGIGGASFPAGLAAEITRYVFGVRPLADGTVLIWDGSDFGRVDPRTKTVLARYKTSSGMSSTRHVAIAPDGGLWSGMAMSWSSQDDPTEYYATVAAFAADGTKKREWTYEDGLPTSTGSSLRLIALDGTAILSEHGTVWMSPDRASLRRHEPMSHPALRPNGEIFGIGNTLEVVRTHLEGGGLGVFAKARDGEYLKQVVLDGAAHVYVATTAAVVGLDAHGAEMFRIEPFVAERLVIGEGYLLAAGSQPGDGIVRIH